jgi:hypothetical protein
MRRKICGFLVMLGLGLATIGVTPSPAGADGNRCNAYSSGYGATFYICVTSAGASAEAYGYVQPFGSGDTTPETAIVAEITIYLSQCRGDGSHCATLASVHDTTNGLETGWRETSFGHVYRGCGSAGVALNVCSPFVTA